MQRTGLNLDVKEDHCGINMTYQFIHDYVTYDSERIMQALAEQRHPVDLDTYVTAITLHELGHSTDREALLASIPQSIEVLKLKQGLPVPAQYGDPNVLGILIEEDERNLVFEKTAWENAGMLNSMHQLVRPDDFDAIAIQSLGTYEKKLADKKHQLSLLGGQAIA